MIREAREQDLSVIFDIHKTALPEDLLSNLSKEYLIKHFYQSFFDEDAIFLVYCEDNTVLGFLIIALHPAQVVRKLRYSFSLLGEIIKKIFIKSSFILVNILGILFVQTKMDKSYLNSPEIYLIAVRDSFQGKSIGSQLIEEGFSRLRKLGYASCLVKTSYENAKQFYEKNGFVVIGDEIRFKRYMYVLGKIIAER